MEVPCIGIADEHFYIGMGTDVVGQAIKTSPTTEHFQWGTWVPWARHVYTHVYAHAV